MGQERAAVSISHLEAGGSIYIALGGSAIILDPHASDHGLPNLAQPKLPEFTHADAVDDTGIDLFRLLRWDHGLVKRLYGRDDELQSILKWAESGSAAASARLVSGSGGVGKTRLAAEAARRLKDKGWTAGFIPADARSRPFRIKPDTGLFLILDYPEERPDETQWLFRLVADLVEAPCPIRLLLLSRREFQEWEKEALLMEGRFGRQAIAALGGLTPEQTVGLIEEAATHFAKLVDRARPGLDGVAEWVGRSPNNRLPLFATAAAVHAVLEPDKAFELGGGDLIRALADRERRRVDAISVAVGLGKTGLAHLLALGVLADGLSQAEVKALAGAGAVEASPETALDRIAQTPWWRGGALVRLEPDKPAAAFMDAVLFPPAFPSGRDELPHWLFLVLQGRVETLADRLERVHHDLFTLSSHEAAAHPLDPNLLAMLERHPAEIPAFAPLAYADVSVWVAPLAAAVAAGLVAVTTDADGRARLLNKRGTHLSLLGQLEEALAAAKEAVTIRRDLARGRPEAFMPDLAGSLINLANQLSRLGRREEALVAAKDAVTIHRDLVRARPETFTPNLASSLNNLANILSDLGQREEALSTATEAATLFRDLARDRPEAFRPNFATSLINLANRLAELGRRQEALTAAKEAVRIRRDLARTRPEAFTPDLAMSLNNLAAVLSELGRGEEAVATFKEAVTIRRDLARARPGAFAPPLAVSLTNLANQLSSVGLHEEALAAADEAVAPYRDLARERPETSTPKLAAALNNLGVILSALGQHDQALAAVKEAVTIRRKLARERPEVFMPDLAQSLNNIARPLSKLGHREHALAAVKEAAALYRDLARARPKVFMSDLATSLGHLSVLFTGLGQHEEALAAAQEAAALDRERT